MSPRRCHAVIWRPSKRTRLRSGCCSSSRNDSNGAPPLAGSTSCANKYGFCCSVVAWISRKQLRERKSVRTGTRPVNQLVHVHETAVRSSAGIQPCERNIKITALAWTWRSRFSMLSRSSTLSAQGSNHHASSAACANVPPTVRNPSRDTRGR
jgi:hypothetical protein